jgi:hypothetical protein
MILAMDVASRSGLMALGTRVSGRMTKLTVAVA